MSTLSTIIHNSVYSATSGGYLMNMPLTSSILSGRGSLVSHTRGGSGATVTDFEGIVRQGIADEIRFVGARRVENIAIKSEGWVVGDDGGSTDPWLYTAANATSTINADGTITFTAAAADFNSAAFAQLNAVTTTLGYKAGQEYIGQIRIRTSGASGDMRLRLRSSGPYQSGPTKVVTVTNAWQTLVLDILTKNADSNLVALELVGQAAGGLTEVDVEFGMIERVDGQTIQVPSEYVSTGVGTGPDQLTNGGFDVDAAGWTEANSPSVSVTGGQVTITGTGTTNSRLYQNIIGVAPTERTYVAVIEVTAASGVWFIRATDNASGGGGSDYAVRVVSASTTGVYTLAYRVTGTNHVIAFGAVGATDSMTAEIISVKEVDHGSNVDGVEYFNTQNGNSIVSNVLVEATGAAITDADLQGVLIEEASTNICTESWDLTQAAWTKTNSQIDSTDIKGWLTDAVYRLEDGNTTTAQHEATISVTAANTGVVTHSFYCQADEKDGIAFTEDGDGTGARTSYFNLGTGAWGTTDAAHTVHTDEIATGVFRLAVETTWTAGARPVTLSLCDPAGTISYAGVVGEGMWAGGLQCEELEDATSYIPTNGATVTRLDEELTLSLTDTLGETGTAAATITPNFTGATTANKQIISDPSASGEQILGIAKLLAASTTFEVDRGNAATQNTDTTNGVGTITAWTRYKAALTWDKAANTMLCVADGGTVQTTTTANAMTDVTQLQIGNISTGAMPANSPIRDVIITKKLSTNAELVGLTT